jgi:hypothetical protein
MQAGKTESRIANNDKSAAEDKKFCNSEPLNSIVWNPFCQASKTARTVSVTNTAKILPNVALLIAVQPPKRRKRNEDEFRFEVFIVNITG